MDFIQNLNNINEEIVNILHINGFVNSISTFMTVIVFVISIVHCFFGYKLLKWWTSFIGFILFGVIGFKLYYITNGELRNSIICGIIVGMIGIFVSVFFYKLGLLVVSAGSGFLFGYMVLENVQVGVILGAICGVLVSLFMRPVLIITISISSAIFASRNLAIMLGASKGVSIILLIVFSVLGIIFQWKNNDAGRQIGFFK